jgi:hypothetical protein
VKNPSEINQNVILRGSGAVAGRKVGRRNFPERKGHRFLVTFIRNVA